VTLLLVAICSASAATPIEKVVVLLKDLQAKVETQGAKEAAQYDKFACFCKNQAGFKKDHIDKSEDQIEVLTADIKDKDAKIKSLNADIADLGKDIAQLEKDIKTNDDKRAKDYAEYQAKAKDLSEAIASCDEAIEALKTSKKEMSGAKVDLAQLKTSVLKMKLEQTPEAMKEALMLVKTAQVAAHDVDEPGKAAKYAYQSNDIIATIEGLADTFRANKADLDTEEGELAQVSNKKGLGFNNEKTFKSKEKKEKEALSEQTTAEKIEDEESKDAESQDKKSDENFLKTLVSNCEDKAKEWDQRSEARSKEISALAEATATLAEATAMSGANKKLVGLVDTSPKDSIKKVSAPVPVSKPADKAKPTQTKKATPSFLQLRSVGSSQAAAVERLLSNLDSAATRLRSPVLAAIALKVQLKIDHFTNVRALIKDLISKMKSDAKAEASTKSFCDTEMGKAVSRRDTAALNIEEQNGIIAKNTALVAQKTEEIEDLSQQVAKMNQDILDAEELRKSEKVDNTQTVADAKAGTAAVKNALTTLKGFYSAAFLQGDYKPPNSDRSGQTVGDRAPEVFSGEYNGSGDSAKGILGILEVIQSDFERTVTETEKAEKKAAADHEKFLTGIKKDIVDKSKDKVDAIKAKEGGEQAIVQAKDDLHDADNLHESADAELTKLSPMCVDGEETYEERVQKRRDEIAALKEAMTILDDWQK